MSPSIDQRDETIHLDTARIGRLRPDSLDALQSFSRFLAAHGRIPKFSSVFRDGFAALPAGLQDEFPKLKFWRGLQAFQDSISLIAVGNPSPLVIFSAQSTALMVFAAHVLARGARRILCTDLEFPLLQQAIRSIQEQYGGSLEVLPLRQAIEEEGCDAEELTRQIITAYEQRQCQAIVLSQVTQEGIRLPCEEIIRRLRAFDSSAFLMVDGAQGLELEPSTGIAGQADLYFGVTHKWLEGPPLGIMLAARESSLDLVKATLKDLVEKYVITDPYLRLLAYVSGIAGGRMYETISFDHLFVSAVACQSSAAQTTDSKEQRYQRFRKFIKDLEGMASVAGCRFRRRDPSLWSGIAVLDWPNAVAVGAPDLESALETAGVIVTGLSATSIRVSAPTGEFTDRHWLALERVLNSINKPSRAIAVAPLKAGLTPAIDYLK